MHSTNTKDYISLVEGTATPDRLQKSPLTQPLPVCSVQKDMYCSAVYLQSRQGEVG